MDSKIKKKSFRRENNEILNSINSNCIYRNKSLS